MKFKNWVELSYFLEHLEIVDKKLKIMFLDILLEDYSKDIINTSLFNNNTLLSIMLFGVIKQKNRMIFNSKTITENLHKDKYTLIKNEFEKFKLEKYI